jgi:uncharacterized protein YbjQ (UPF0145 family)
MLMTTMDHLANQSIGTVLGVVKGSTVRSKHMGRDFFAGLKSMVGGELKGYTELLAESRAQAERRMAEEAEELGADAIVAIRYTTSAVTQGAAEILVYGTAVKFS